MQALELLREFTAIVSKDDPSCWDVKRARQIAREADDLSYTHDDLSMGDCKALLSILNFDLPAWIDRHAMSIALKEINHAIARED